MKFICEKAALVSAISLASHTVSPKSALVALEGILLRATGAKLYLTGYNLETGITASASAEVREGGMCIMPARLFFDIVRKLPDERVTITVDEKYRVVCTSGNAQTIFSAASAEDYPELPDVDNTVRVDIPRNALRQMITGTLFSASTNLMRPVHTGCLFEVAADSITAVAVDGYRLALRRWTPPEPIRHEMRFIAPASALKELEKTLGDDDGNCYFAMSKKHLLFKFGTLELVCRQLAGEFLDWRRVLPRESPIRLGATCSRVQASVERVALVIQENARSSVRCVFGENEVTMETNTTIGSARDCCPLSGNGGELEIGFNSKFLSEALRAVPDEEVMLELSNSLSPIVMTPCDGSGRFAYMVLPVRLKAGE